MARYFIRPSDGVTTGRPVDPDERQVEELLQQGFVEVDEATFERHVCGEDVDLSRFEDDGPELPPAA